METYEECFEVTKVVRTDEVTRVVAICPLERECDFDYVHWHGEPATVHLPKRAGGEVTTSLERLAYVRPAFVRTIRAVVAKA